MVLHLFLWVPLCLRAFKLSRICPSLSSSSDGAGWLPAWIEPEASPHSFLLQCSETWEACTKLTISSFLFSLVDLCPRDDLVAVLLLCWQA